MKRNRKWVKRTILFVIVGCMALAVVWAMKVARSFAGKGQSLLDVWQGIRDPQSQFPKHDRVVILIAGKDYDHDKKDMPSSANSRADTVMLVCADLTTKRLSAVSIPRDTRVLGPDGQNHKINAMLPMGGIKLLAKTISDQFGVTPDYYVVLKDQAVKNMVDAVGGVDVDVLDDMFYQDSWGDLSIDLHKGHQRLNGSQAIGYVRFRKMGDHKIVNGKIVPVPHRSSMEEGDIRRTERQQLMLHELMKEAMSPGNIIHADSLIDTGFQQMDTNLTRLQVLALATIFRGQSLSSSPTATIPGSDNTDSGTYYYVADIPRTKLTMKWLIYGDEAAGRKLVRVVVYNASGKNGLARDTVSDVSAQGFTAINGGTAAVSPTSAITFRKAAQEPFARDLGAKLKIATVTKDPGDPRNDWRPEIKVTLGQDVAGEAATIPSVQAGR